MKRYGKLFILLILAAFIVVLFTRSEIRAKSIISGNKPDTSLVNPKVDIKVNKEFDRNGNVIRYDSTYTYIYTYPNGNKETINIDSVFKSFKPYFFDKGIDLMQKPFIDFFESDSSFQQHFFDHDYFINQFENEMFRFEEMMREMDSLRNLYLKEIYPEIKLKNTPKPKSNPEETKEI
ncbi:MAG: hypothetical protein AB7S50_09435 [Bacteroidales bacterium]